MKAPCGINEQGPLSGYKITPEERQERIEIERHHDPAVIDEPRTASKNYLQVKWTCERDGENINGQVRSKSSV